MMNLFKKVTFKLNNSIEIFKRPCEMISNIKYVIFKNSINFIHFGPDSFYYFPDQIRYPPKANKIVSTPRRKNIFLVGNFIN